MADNNKDWRRPRNSDDPIVNRRTVTMKRTHEKRIRGTSIDRNFSGFVGGLMDDFFQRSAVDHFITTIADAKELTALDNVTLIGNGVDTESANACLLAWLDGKPIPTVKISEKSAGKYHVLYEALKGTPVEGFFVDESRRMLDAVREIYFNQKSIHLTSYQMLVRLLVTRAARGKWRKYAVERMNDLIGMEHRYIDGYCIFSPHIRFAVYDCWRNQIFRVRALRPGWTAMAGEDFTKMNEVLKDPETEGIEDDPADFDDVPADY